jgi:hypothetical protein
MKINVFQPSYSPYSRSSRRVGTSSPISCYFTDRQRTQFSSVRGKISLCPSHRLKRRTGSPLEMIFPKGKKTNSKTQKPNIYKKEKAAKRRLYGGSQRFICCRFIAYLWSSRSIDAVLNAEGVFRIVVA